ncbi:MAG: hypothetical protein LBJ75_03775 [Puniceicoccales bacterium]|nr:hypothetical protein [Puniceicoccales bacterium]
MMNKEAGRVMAELHSIMGRIWILWKGIAIASHLVYVSCQLGNHKRKNIRLFVSITGD